LTSSSSVSNPHYYLIEIFPNRIDVLISQHLSDFSRTTGVVDLKLFGGFFGSAAFGEFDAPTFDR
jgi:hypothetical protein